MSEEVLDTWISRLEADLFGRTLPFWLQFSVDNEHGGFFNCLDESGEVWDTTKHVWLQGRQCWMWAKIANTYTEDQLHALSAAHGGQLKRPSTRPQRSKAKALAVEFTRAELIKHAHAGVLFLLDHAVQKETGHVLFALTRDGAPSLVQRKIFSATFLIMACNEVSRATGEAWLRDRALSLLSDVLHWIRTPGALGKASCSGALPFCPLNVPMILLNVLMECMGGLAKEEASLFMLQERDWAVAEIRKHWVEIPDALSPGTVRRVVLENVLPDGSTEFSAHDGRLMNPGHAIEAGWFLLEYARFIGDGSLRSLSMDIIRCSFQAGWDGPIDALGTLGHPAASAVADAAGHSTGAGSGGMIYFTDAEGFSPSPLESSMKLWWPQAEAMIAFAMAYDAALQTLEEEELGGAERGKAEASAEEYWASFVRVADWTYGHLVDETQGEWFGYSDRSGAVTHRFKGGPYKGCFHVPRALVMASQYLRAARERKGRLQARADG